MKNEIRYFKVSSADWDFLIDSPSRKDAALSALLMAFCKYGKDILLSTTIMIKEIKKSTKDNNTSFVGTHEVLREIGLKDLSNTFMKISQLPRNDIKSIR